MKTTKKLLCILLGILFVMSAGAVPGMAAGKSGNLTDTATWSFADGTLTVSGKGAIPDLAINRVIQENGLQVKKAVIENGITALGGSAYSMCDTLETVSLPASMRIISRSSFECCTALKEIDIPNGVQYIASSAFQACTSLSKVTLPASLRVIESAAFRTCSALTGIRLPAGLSYIGIQAFMETGLTDVVVPGSVRILDGWAFSQCHSLKSAVLSVGLTTLYDCTFQNSALEYVVLPKSVTTVSDLAFYYCTLKELYYEGSEAEFNAINIRREGEPLGVPGTTEEIFRTADLHVNYNGLSARGDMDGKNGVATADARTVLRTAVDLEQIQNGTYDFYRADVNFDATISTADARLVLRDAVDLEDLTKSGAPQPKACTAAELDAPAAFSGTFTELLANAGLVSPFDEECLRGVCEAASKWLESYDLGGIE